MKQNRIESEIAAIRAEKKKLNLIVRLSPGEKRRISDAAKRMCITQSALARYAIMNIIDQYDESGEQ